MTHGLPLALLAGVALGATASAQCTGGVPLVDEHVALHHGTISLYGPLTLQLPAWDPATHPIGATLTRVELRVTGRLEVDMQLENIYSSASISPTWRVNMDADIQPSAALGTSLMKVETERIDSALLHPFDGLLDFDGPSGESWLGELDEDPQPPVVVDTGPDLQLWIGSGTHDFVHGGAGSAFIFGGIPGIPIQSNSTFALRFELEYTWCAPPIGLAYCFGDGSGAPCPCANQGAPGAGCAHSSAPGATLLAAGSASVAADDLELLAEALPAGRTTLLFAGANAIQGGAGAPLADGLRCAGGDVRRLALVESGADGAARFGPGLLGAGGLSAGETRYFQVWFRDPPGPCAGGSNLTPGIELALTP